MVRSMFDGITASEVPDGWGVAGYIDGKWPDFAALQLRWPAAAHISIAASAADDAKALDVETGDATPAQAPGWTARQRARGDAYPWVYCNESTWAEAIYEFTLQRVPVPLWWVARYDGIAVVPPGAIAKQHTNTPGYDQSVVADYVPGIDPAPKPPAPPTAPILQEDDMALCIDAPRAAEGTTRDIFLLEGGKYGHVATATAYAGYQAAGVKTAVVDFTEHQRLLATYGGTAVAV